MEEHWQKTIKCVMILNFMTDYNLTSSVHVTHNIQNIWVDTETFIGTEDCCWGLLSSIQGLLNAYLFNLSILLVQQQYSKGEHWMNQRIAKTTVCEMIQAIVLFLIQSVFAANGSSTCSILTCYTVHKVIATGEPQHLWKRLKF